MNKKISLLAGKKIFSAAMALTMALMVVGPASTFAATGYTAAQVATHNNINDCWLIISGQVYNVTNFIPAHPGGNAIVPFCGTDATTVYNQIHGSSPTAAADLLALLIGNVITALTAPLNVVGTPTQTTVALTWTASSGGVTPLTYSIKRNGTTVGTSTVASFTDTGLTASTTYSYVIQVTDGATPTATSLSSAAVSVTTLAVTVSGPLTAPSILAATPTQTSAALTWTASTGGVAPIVYSIMRNGTTVGTSSTASFTDTGLASSTTYSYVVKAIDSATPTPGTASSAALSVTTLSASTGTDTVKPTVSITAPANRAKVTGMVTITVSASDNVGVTKIILYIDGKQVATGSSSTLSFSWDAASALKGSHTIRAQAFDAAGNIGVSKAVRVKVKNTGTQHQNGNGDKNENEGNSRGQNDN